MGLNEHSSCRVGSRMEGLGSTLVKLEEHWIQNQTSQVVFKSYEPMNLGKLFLRLGFLLWTLRQLGEDVCD